MDPLLPGATPGGEQRHKSFLLHSGKHASRKFNWTLGNAWLVKSRPNHETKKNVSDFHTKSPSQYGMAPVLNVLWRPCLLEPLINQHMEVSHYNRTWSVRLKKKRNQQYCQERILVLMYGRLVAIAQLAVDKIYHFCATRIHIYIYIYMSLTVYCLAINVYYFHTTNPHLFFRKHFQNPISSESSYAFHPSKRRAAFVNFSLAWREEVHIHWGRLECPLEFCMVWNL